jgi:putative membrane protein insertion efficiency factor
VSVPARLLVTLLRGYQFFSCRLPNRCRYWPTCSVYAAEAITLWGAGRGSWLAARRLGRCHPWGGCGPDPVPEPPPHPHPTRWSGTDRGAPSQARTPMLTK